MKMFNRNVDILFNSILFGQAFIGVFICVRCHNIPAAIYAVVCIILTVKRLVERLAE